MVWVCCPPGRSSRHGQSRTGSHELAVTNWQSRTDRDRGTEAQAETLGRGPLPYRYLDQASRVLVPEGLPPFHVREGSSSGKQRPTHCNASTRGKVPRGNACPGISIAVDVDDFRPPCRLTSPDHLWSGKGGGRYLSAPHQTCGSWREKIATMEACRQAWRAPFDNAHIHRFIAVGDRCQEAVVRPDEPPARCFHQQWMAC